jgi:excisionase family DNA binding protein
MECNVTEVAIMEPEIMTITQVAKYLQISEITMYKLVNEGRIPGFKIGRHWRVKKEDLTGVIEKLKRGERL